MRPLTLKQEKFVEATIRGINGINAAREAGYKGNDVTLGAVAYENLNKPLIKQAIDEHRAEIKAKAEYCIETWRRDTITARASAAIAKQWAAVAAFDRLLAQHLGALELDNKQKAEQRQLSEKEAELAKEIAPAIIAAQLKRQREAAIKLTGGRQTA